MITMAIMVILAALVAVAMGGAEESARVSHTRAEIARLHTLIMDRFESYRWRRLPVQSTSVTNEQNNTTDNPTAAAQLRCNAVRELMRMEMPDRWTDIDLNDPPVVLKVTTTAYAAYQQAYQAAVNSNGGTALDPTYQGADCLYWIVTMGLEENDVLENFSQGDIGPDPKNPNAGLLCFLDSWGNPIQFLRWAPGFNSPMQPLNAATNTWPTDPDQTDPTGVYGKTQANGGAVSGKVGGTPPPLSFALYPLIYSAGPDGYYDILSDTQFFPSMGPLRYSQTANTTTGLPANNPFVNVGRAYAIGSPYISTANTTGQLGNSDNIHNQEIGSH